MHFPEALGKCFPEGLGKSDFLLETHIVFKKGGGTKGGFANAILNLKKPSTPLLEMP